MTRHEWLRTRKLADPRTTVVQHIAGGGLHSRAKAACGDWLPAADGSADPGPDAPVCSGCARALTAESHRTRLLSAYRHLRDRHPSAVYAALLVVVIAAVTGFLVTALELSPWAPLAAGILAAVVLLLRFAPDDESDGKS